MKPIQFAGLFGTFLLGVSHSLADETAATITQASDKITHSMSATGPGESAGAGTALHSGEFVKTGKTALAEVVLANKTVTRLGPGTVLAYSSASREATVDSGTLLFSKPKDGEAMTFQMGSVTAAVTGTTGFVERTGDSVYLGIIEGTVHVTVGTAKAILHAGNMLVATGKNGQVVSFDVPHFVSTSAFFHSFQRTLPNEPAIEHEIVAYQDKVARGFIAPATVTPPSVAEHHELTATIHSSGHEMASSAMNTSLVAGRSSIGTPGTSLASGGSSSGLTISGAGLDRDGGGVVQLGGGAGSFGNVGISGGTITLNGNGGSSAITTTGAINSTGAITFASGYSGTINVTNGGTFIINGNTYHINGPGTITVNHGTLSSINAQNGLTVNGGGTITGGATGGSLGGAGTISVTSGNTGGGLTVTSGTVIGGTSTLSGTTTISGGIPNPTPPTPSGTH